MWDEVDHPGMWLRIGACILTGLVVGAERQFRGKPVGMRTSILICLGTMSFVQLAQLPGDQGQHTARVLGQIVSGVGFLGGGVILTQGGLVLGVTSAAVVWILAAIGAAIGLERYGLGAAVAGVSVGVLVGIEFLENAFKSLRKGVHSHTTQRTKRQSD